MDIDAALDDIECVVVDGDMRPAARAKAGEQLEAVADELSRLRADNTRLRQALESASAKLGRATNWADIGMVLNDIDRALGTDAADYVG